MDDSINEQLLNCLCSLVTLACRLGLAEAKHATLKTICRAVRMEKPAQKHYKITSFSGIAQPVLQQIH
jgi:hypothetical protein